jgi:hypothetical protein
MKMLFSTSDRSEIRQVKKKLFAAGIRCEVRRQPVGEGLFGVVPIPELWIKKESDILKALRLIGSRRLSRMTVIVPQDMSPAAAG